uniref:Serine/threonine-protein kinase LMTK2-like isoform X3 n=1 Tax=Crassostrea virginica TaxID=6565 RepID=A0A8B8CKX0_CRAVI|nr:serine/threonine-protein kinase LMTK2-like isoform X3 [Crassostrea virginica]
MLDIAVLAGIGLSFASVLLVLGCVCQLFKKSTPGFSNDQEPTFENDVEAGHGQGFSIFSAHNTAADTSDVNPVTFEPLPDILAKTVSATALRPRISSVEREQQRITAKHITVYRPFPRSNLLYVKEIGIGWFGQVLEGDAEKINVNSKKTRVVVKLLKDDATGSEQQLFLEEVAVYREIEHPNVLQLMGQCTESLPFLVILEQAPFGDIKSYLQRCLPEKESFLKRGTPLKFAIDMAAGLASLHRHGYLHHDFACRNCLVMSDLSVKVGDYGVAEDHYREDYYDTGQNLLPIRWMAPETLRLQDHIWQVTEFSKESNIWSFGVALWEVLEFGKKPYQMMSDEEVLQKVVKLRAVGLNTSTTEDQKALSDLVRVCCVNAELRPSLEDIHARLLEIQRNRQDHEAAKETEFDSKWEQAFTKEEPKVVQVQNIIPFEPSGAGDVQEVVKSPISLPSKSSPVVVIADVHVQPKDHMEKSHLHSPRSSISNGKVDTSVNKLKSVKEVTSNVPLKEEKGVENVELNGHVTSDLENGLDVSASSENLDQDLNNEKTEKSPKKQITLDDSVNLEGSFDILGGNYDNQVENLKNFQSPMPMLNSPLKISSSDHLTSTPVAKDTKTEEVSPSGKSEAQTESTDNEVLSLNQVPDGSESPTGRGSKSGKAMIPRTLSDEMEDDGSLRRYTASDLDKALDLLLEDEGKDDISETKRESIGSAEGSDDEDEEEKLKLLRMSIASAFEHRGNESQGNEESQGSDKEDENFFMDDLDIAKEIYRSKGTTIPPTNHTTSRTLNTIPEDGIPTEDNIVETARNSNTDSTKSSPTKKALKFDDPFDETIFSSSTADTFEWDDYIGDELVGKVNDEDFQDSPRQTMEFPDWTLEMDASSSNSGTESMNHSKAGSEAGDSRPGSRASNRLSTSESEVKSPVGMAARSYVKDLLSKKRSSASPSLSSYISDKSSFYALSHNYDLDSSEHVPSDTDLSNSPVSISNGDGAFIEDWDLV